jgi:hypothetical protein
VILVGELTADGGGFFFLGVGGHVGLFVEVWVDEEGVLKLLFGLVEGCCC